MSQGFAASQGGVHKKGDRFRGMKKYHHRRHHRQHRFISSPGGDFRIVSLFLIPAEISAL